MRTVFLLMVYSFILCGLFACAGAAQTKPVTGQSKAAASAADNSTKLLPAGASADNSTKADNRTDRKEAMSSYADVQAFIAEITKKHKFDSSFMKKALDEAYFDYTVTALMDKPAEKHPWSYYSQRVISKDRVDGGIAYMKKHDKYLQTAATEWKVPPDMVTAIIGVESTYGTYMFKRNAVTSLGTFAFEYPRRATYFKSELENLFVLANNEKADPLSYMGSYAGAIGIAQFMPSNIIVYGKDGDKDGHVDIVKSHADAIHSVAYYINKHGWQAGKNTVALVTVKDNISESAYSFSPCDASKRKTVKELKQLGVKFNETYPDTALGILSQLDEDDDKFTPIVFFENACPVYKYNHSLKYTAAISLLAKSLEKAATSAKTPAAAKK